MEGWSVESLIETNKIMAQFRILKYSFSTVINILFHAKRQLPIFYNNNNLVYVPIWFLATANSSKIPIEPAV